MAYEIAYGEERKRKSAPMAAAWFLVFLLLVGTFWPRGRVLLRQILIPGDWVITGQAMECLVRDLGAGEDLGQAVEAFCGRILEGAIAEG